MSYPSFKEKDFHAIAEKSKRTFGKHAIKDEGPGRWYFAEPGTSLYAFRVVIGPYFVLLTGDVGHGLFLVNAPDTIDWLRGVSFDSPDYYLSKLEPMPRRASYRDLWVVECLAVFAKALRERVPSGPGGPT